MGLLFKSIVAKSVSRSKADPEGVVLTATFLRVSFLSEDTVFVLEAEGVSFAVHGTLRYTGTESKLDG